MIKPRTQPERSVVVVDVVLVVFVAVADGDHTGHGHGPGHVYDNDFMRLSRDYGGFSLLAL
jgi:hypothetical protein